MQKAKISPTSDEYVLDQLSQCEEKLLKLLEELDQTGKDMNEISKQMEEEEVGFNCISLFSCNVFYDKVEVLSSIFCFVVLLYRLLGLLLFIFAHNLNVF